MGADAVADLTPRPEWREVGGVDCLHHRLHRPDLWHFDAKPSEGVAGEIGFPQMLDSHLNRHAQFFGGRASVNDVPFADGAMLSIGVDQIAPAPLDRSLYWVSGRMARQSHLADRLTGEEALSKCTLTQHTHTPIMFCLRSQQRCPSTERSLPGGSQPGMNALRSASPEPWAHDMIRFGGSGGLASPVRASGTTQFRVVVYSATDFPRCRRKATSRPLHRACGRYDRYHTRHDES
jgi:hypothetical protein